MPDTTPAKTDDGAPARAAHAPAPGSPAPDPAAFAPTPRRGPSDPVLWGVIAAAVVACAALVAVTPVERMLGNWLKLVLFHGASTWVNLGTFTLMGLLAVAYLVTRRPGVYAYVAATRYVSFLLWIFNTALGMVSAWLTWGPAFWSEPRLQLSFWVLLLLALAMAVDIVVDRPVLHSSFDIVIAGFVWVFVVATPTVVHPNSPVGASGWDIKAIFGGMVLFWAVATAVAIRLWAERLKAQGAGVPGMPDEAD